MATPRDRGGGQRPYVSNTIGLSAKSLLRLLESLDEGASPHSPHRTHARWPFRAMALPVDIVEQTGTRRLNLACRNLSGGGVSLLHSAYMYPGTRCVVTLPKLGGGIVRLAGAVVRCVHREGVVHEVGVKFDEAIDVHDFVELDPMSGWFTPEKVNPDSVEGTLVHVEPSSTDQNVLRHLLRDTLLRIRTAETGAEGLKLAAEKADVIVLSHELEDMPAPKFVGEVAAVTRAPLVLTSADDTPEVRLTAARPNVAGFVAKPFRGDTLIRAVAEVVANAKKAPDADDGMGAIRRHLLRELQGTVDAVRAARERGDAMAIYSACLQVKGSAPAVGLVDLGQLAELIVARLTQRMELDPLREELDEFVGLCAATVAEAA